MRSFISILLNLFFIPMVWAGGNWPDYRGPHGDGTSQATGLLVKWSEAKNVRWKTAIHDRGHSSPVIWDKQIWLTTATEDGHKLYSLCVDRETGKILVDHNLFEVAEPQHSNSLNSYASPSPVIEKDRVYVHYVIALNKQTGQRIWSKWIGGNYSASLLYADGRIYIFSQEGKTTLIKPMGNTFEKIVENQLDDRFMASPAIIGNALYLRSLTHLYRIESDKGR